MKYSRLPSILRPVHCPDQATRQQCSRNRPRAQHHLNRLDTYDCPHRKTPKNKYKTGKPRNCLPNDRHRGPRNVLDDNGDKRTCQSRSRRRSRCPAVTLGYQTRGYRLSTDPLRRKAFTRTHTTGGRTHETMQQRNCTRQLRDKHGVATTYGRDSWSGSTEPGAPRL